MASYWIKNWPCATRRVTSPYGYRTHPITGVRTLHNGIDLAPVKKVGEPIKAIAAGKVVISKYSSTAGYYVKIDHGNGWESVYMHMQKGLKVKAGQKVAAGKVLGNMGSTGSSTAQHLHFGMMYKGVYKNPLNYLKLIGTFVWSKTDKVKAVQKLIGVKDDGIWGKNTQAAYAKYIKTKANVKKLQTLLNKWESPDLVVDGIAGSKTKAAVNKLK